MTTARFVLPIVAFALGIGVGTAYPVPLAVVAWCGIVASALALLWRRAPRTDSAGTVLLMGVCLLGFMLGLFRAEGAGWGYGDSPLSAVVGDEVSLVGTVVREPDVRERTVHLYVRSGADTVLVTTDRLLDVDYGDSVTVTGTLREPEAFETDLGRTFDYPGYLLARGVEYRIGFAEVSVNGPGDANPLLAGVFDIKHAFMDALKRSIPEPQVALGQGLLLGVQQSLGEDIEEDFRRTGIIHIVVLSGYNVMLVASFMLFCLSFLLPLRARVVGGIAAIAVFAFLVGLSATVVRASVMAAVLLVAQGLGRTYDVIRALFAAGAVMLLINPYLLLYDIGFQLSFMATLGLVLLLPHFESTVQRSGFVSLSSFFTATVVTQIAVLPLLLYHIGQVSLIAVVVNVLVLPVVPIAMFLTFLTGLAAVVSAVLAQLIGVAAAVSLSYILLVAEWFAALPFAAVTVPTFSGLQVLGAYLVLGGGWYWWQRRRPTLSEWVIEEETETGAAPLGAAPAEVPQAFR